MDDQPRLIYIATNGVDYYTSPEIGLDSLHEDSAVLYEYEFKRKVRFTRAITEEEELE